MIAMAKERLFDKDASESLLVPPNQGCSDSAPMLRVVHRFVILMHLGSEQLLYSVFT
jgi:hypothetical protein